MNKHAATKKRLAKPSRSVAAPKPSPRKASARATARKQPRNGHKVAAISVSQVAISQVNVGQMSVGQISVGQIDLGHVNGHLNGNGRAKVSPVAAFGSALRAHKFCVGQTVLYTSSPISRPGASGSYKVVRLLPSDGDDYQYRIKHAGEAFERVAKESQLELES